MDYSWIGITRAHMSDENMIKSGNSLLKWPNKFQQKSATGTTNPWIHPPGSLQGAHVAYLVKFLGCTEVDQAKGMDVVKAGIQKMRFNSHVKRSEGSKIPKVELTISIDGVAIQDPKTKKILYQYPLYRISFCADDQAEKRFFCFIAKEDNASTEHRCFVFVSDRLAENIKLTIAQAFDLAYRRFLETSGRDLEMRKQLLVLQKRTKLLERENADLRTRLAELEGGYVGSDRSLANESSGTNSRAESLDEAAVPRPNGHLVMPSYSSAPANLAHHVSPVSTNGQSEIGRLQPPPVPPRPREGGTSPAPLVSGNGAHSDLIVLDPFAVTMTPEEDPFGDFHKLFNGPGVGGNKSTTDSTKHFDDAISRVDKRILEMREGFTRGLVFGHDDFSLDAFDPLKTAKDSDTSHA